MTKPTGKGCTRIAMVPGIKEPGRMIYKKDEGRKHGMMEANMRAPIQKERKMGRASTLGATKAAMKVTGWTTKLLEKFVVYKGVYKWIDGRVYDGEWKDNNMHGKGIYTWKDGRVYEGDYYMDKKHGFGTYTWADGRMYEGQWYNGKQHGEGRYTLQDGTVKTGIWENGKRLKWISE